MDKVSPTGSPSKIENGDPLHIATCVRSFSESGGLELYAHRIVEGLLERGHRVTVICEVSDSKLTHPSLEKLYFPPAPDGRKADRISHHFKAASKFVAENGPFDVIHSQHLPMSGADAVTFHNHTANRIVQVGQGWEKLLNNAKMIYSTAYKLRYSQDEILCRSGVLLFPAKVTRDDFASTYKLDSRPSPPSYVVAHPGANFPGQLKAEEPGAARGDSGGAVGGAAGGMSSDNSPGSSSDPSGASPSHGKPFTFLFVGKGFRKKGLDILLRSCQILNKGGTPCRLIIAGLKAKPFDKLRLNLMGLSNAVEYLGFRKDMHNVYAQANATILPSRIEPFGMAPIQGMMHGLVPIVSAVSGVSEVLTDGVDSLILQNHLSPEDLSSLMKRLIDSPAKLAEMSAKARETAAKLTWDLTVDETLRAYRIVVQKKALEQQHKAKAKI
jgi:glycosyltransferase involved in cell wall biosynthesis